jgi:uncharacterized Ntn-hydrolase superfamily protein
VELRAGAEAGGERRAQQGAATRIVLDQEAPDGGPPLAAELRTFLEAVVAAAG